MDIKKSLGIALKQARKTKNLSQEEFSVVSSRTYVSTLERGLYSPTVEKLEDLAKVLDIHPLTLLALAYLKNEKSLNTTLLLKRIKDELEVLHTDN
ncbi:MULTISPECIES: helix-turn-helix domain-containing protein [Methylotenera]|uniref:helix-turn-helix domain-containing protein n=1 Tax=Methylotenera TaxID=359407 RepID=UPI0009DA95E5|nr:MULTISPECIES: helix-turn-helix transcriptional regulator [Methylotenera]